MVDSPYSWLLSQGRFIPEMYASLGLSLNILLDSQPRDHFLIAVMGLAISTSFNYSLSLDKNLRAISACGFQYISLGGKISHSQYDKPEGRQKLKALLEENRLALDSVHAPFDPTSDLSHPEDIMARGALIEMKRAISAASELGAPNLVVHLSPFRPSNFSERIRRIKGNLPELVKAAESLGVNIALENGDSESDPLLKFALDLIDSPRLRFCYDNGHEQIYDIKLDLLQRYGARLAVIHLHDNDGKKDLHLVPFEGKLDLSAVAAQLNKLKAIPRITLECEMPNSRFATVDGFLTAAFAGGRRFLEMLKK